jgi:hypothetical protein
MANSASTQAGRGAVLGGQAERLDRDNLADREGVVHLEDVDLPGADTGLLVDLSRGVAHDLEPPDVLGILVPDRVGDASALEEGQRLGDHPRAEDLLLGGPAVFGHGG